MAEGLAVLMAPRGNDQVIRLTKGQRRGLQVGGVVFGVSGVIMILAAFSRFFSVFGSPPDAEQAGDLGVQMFIYFGIGAVLLMIATWLIRLGFLRPFSQIVATETETAVETTGGAFGRGFHGSKDPGAQTEVRLRCRECGNLEAETAKYCSSCGKPV